MGVVILIAISLSMDAFSLSLAYGMYGLQKKDIYILTMVVAIYHFVMPFLGMILGSKIIHLIPISPSFIVFIILTIIGIQMILESNNVKVKKITTIKEFLLFGIAVSLDSFSVGIGLKLLNSNYLHSVLLFSVFSGFFTFIGLNIGNKLNNVLGRVALIIGGILLIIIGTIYLVDISFSLHHCISFFL